jgi:hypothetical protein
LMYRNMWKLLYPTPGVESKLTNPPARYSVAVLANQIGLSTCMRLLTAWNPPAHHGQDVNLT